MRKSTPSSSAVFFFCAMNLAMTGSLPTTTTPSENFFGNFRYSSRSSAIIFPASALPSSSAIEKRKSSADSRDLGEHDVRLRVTTDDIGDEFCDRAHLLFLHAARGDGGSPHAEAGRLKG